MNGGIKVIDGKMRVGVALIKQLSSTFYSKARMTFDELISNSYDSMASFVKIDIGEDRITIEDDGKGMSPEELIKFFHISYTEKLGQFLKRRGKRDRKIIGKFGIGKLSLYQICQKFDIVSVKDGIESKTSFDFNDLEKHKFIDEINLKVSSHPTAGHNTGTKITLMELKKKINSIMLKRELSRTIPLKPDFKLFINGIEVVKELLYGYKFQLKEEDSAVRDEDGKTIGKVSGRFIYTEKPSLKVSEAGVYVRVHGRTVNDNPRLIELSDTYAAHIASRRLYADLHADFLWDAIATNRSSFIADNPKYMIFLSWLKTIVNKYNGKYLKEYKKKDRQEVTEYVMALVPKLKKSDKKTEYLSKPVSASEPEQELVKQSPTEEPGNKIDIKGDKYGVEIMSLGQDSNEFLIDESKKTIIINDRHPLYLESKNSRSLEIHLKRTLAVAVSISISNNIGEFQKNYEEMIRRLLITRFI